MLLFIKMAEMIFRGRKAQTHMSETIAVLFIFFVLISFGIVFYYQYQKSAFDARQEELLAARAIDTTLRALYFPELLCSKGKAEPEANCIDLMKLRHADETLKAHLNDYYFELFSYATITVQQLFPERELYTLYHFPKGNYTRKEPTYFVVSLRDEVAGDSGLAEYGFGYIKVEVYS